MDNKIKIVIVVLIVLAVLFFSGMAGNLVSKKQEGADEKSYKRGGWETTLGKWMAPLAPSLDVKNFIRSWQNKNTCKSKNFEDKYEEIFLNKANDTCVIDIPRLKGEKYSMGKLSLAKAREQAIPEVKVLYLPKGESDESEDDPEPVSLTFKEAISFVVFEKGGTLTVECKGCFDDQDRTIPVIFE